MALLHWKLQRLSAIILVPAIIYIVIYFLNITQFSYSEIISDITSLWGMLFIVFVSLFADLWDFIRFVRFCLILSDLLHCIVFAVLVIYRRITCRRLQTMENSICYRTVPSRASRTPCGSSFGRFRGLS